jgi:peptidoglycan/LPS O-acetylase OafA/YrhL
MFGLRNSLFPGGYLSVDVFFVLSGFVLSLNYGGAISSGAIDARAFIVARFARLYPLFFATTLVGCVVMTARFRSNFGHIEYIALIESSAANLFLAPSFFEPYGLRSLFPFNPASWSIFFELFASVAFFVFLGRLRVKLLLLVIAASAITLALTIWLVGTIDQGYSTATFIPGFPRVLFSFSVGVAIQRCFERRPWRLSGRVLFSTLLLALLFVQARLYVSNIRLYDLVGVYLLAPLIVMVGAGVSLEGLRRRMAAFLGDISYSVYLTHNALIIAAAGLAQVALGAKIYDLGPGVGFAFVPFVVGVSYASYSRLERPARMYIRRWA